MRSEEGVTSSTHGKFFNKKRYRVGYPSTGVYTNNFKRLFLTIKYRVIEFLNPDGWYWAAFQHAAGKGFWRSWLRWQRLRAWQYREVADDILETAPPAPNRSGDWPLETGGLPLDPGVSRSHLVKHKATGDVRRFYWCAEDGSWYPKLDDDPFWTRRHLSVRQVHYSYSYIGPADLKQKKAPRFP